MLNSFRNFTEYFILFRLFSIEYGIIAYWCRSWFRMRLEFGIGGCFFFGMESEVVCFRLARSQTARIVCRRILPIGVRRREAESTFLKNRRRSSNGFVIAFVIRESGVSRPIGKGVQNNEAGKNKHFPTAMNK